MSRTPSGKNSLRAIIAANPDLLEWRTDNFIYLVEGVEDETETKNSDDDNLGKVDVPINSSSSFSMLTYHAATLQKWLWILR